MSAYSGPQAKHAARTRRATKRREAEQRQARSDARRVVETYAAEREGEE